MEAGRCSKLEDYMYVSIYTTSGPSCVITLLSANEASLQLPMVYGCRYGQLTDLKAQDQPLQ